MGATGRRGNHWPSENNILKSSVMQISNQTKQANGESTSLAAVPFNHAQCEKH